MDDGTELTTLCYVERDGRYLMMYRNRKKDDVNAGKYIGIGGHVELHETPDECIVREALEETGLRLRNVRLRGLLTFVIDGRDERTFLYTCSDFEGEAGGCSEGELVWVERDRVRDLPLWEGDAVFLSLLSEREDVFSLKLVYSGGRLTGASLDGEELTDPRAV
jgi:8-oxo-dGTP diphosphatase